MHICKLKLLPYIIRVGKVINKRDKHEDFKEAGGIPSVHVSYISYQVSGDPFPAPLVLRLTSPTALLVLD